tara:strand:- start:3364 stop:4416 length:1053 start_codon:yes stop_codon:yes gene_type:complete
MEDARKNFLLHQIISGLKFIDVNNYRYKLIPASTEILYLAEHVYQDTVADLRFDNFISKDKVDLALRVLDIWQPQDNESLKKLDKHLEDQKVALFLSAYNSDRTKRIRRAIKAAKIGMEKAYIRKHSLDHMTLDYHGMITKQKFITALCLRDKEDKPIYNMDNFNDSNSFILEKVTEVLNADTISMEEYRELARSDIWRSTWNLGGVACLPEPSCRWTQEQKTLITFSKMYDNAYEHPDCPSDTVFQDDDMFDGWMINEKRIREKEKKQKEVDKNEKIDSKAQEVFVFAPTRDDADKVYDLNDLDSRMKVKQRQKFLEVKKKADAKDMPDTQIDLRRQQVDEYKARFRKG